MFRRKGSVWTFFLAMFLVLWTVPLYVHTAGPVYWGIAWLPRIFTGLILGTLLLAIVPVIQQSNGDDIIGAINRESTKSPRIVSYTVPGKLFWILIALVIMAILVGMSIPEAAM